MLSCAVTALAGSNRIGAQQARPTHPLLDSTRLFGAEWTVTTLVRADSLATDSLTLRRIYEAHWLGPGRLVYTGRLARSGQRALLGWVNGTVTLLAIDGREFSVLPGRTIKVRFGEGWLRKTEFAAAGGAFYVSTATGRGLSVYSTDGATWRPVAHREDSVTVRGRRMKVGSAHVVGGENEHPATIALDGDGFEGLAAALAPHQRGPGQIQCLSNRWRRSRLTRDTELPSRNEDCRVQEQKSRRRQKA